ncbi:MAG: ABC transporter substrate-binding protein [Dehalococcoidales bacterium]|nr:ABC transporter substrate-binding protein [Dehalococcoidales bacterium]
MGPATPIGYPAEAAPDAYSLGRPAIETLVRLNKGGIVLPALATSWTIADDGNSITFTLREGVKFHDGSDLTADVVKWNFDTAIEAKKANDWTSVDVVDPMTVRVHLNGYKNTVLTGFSAGAAQIISKANVDTNGLEYARWHPVGTGPFKFKEFIRDASLEYERNDNYWGKDADGNPLPYLDGLMYTVIADETVRNIAFQQGEITRLTATGLVAQQLDQAGYEFFAEAGGTMVLIPDSANPDSPFSDIHVRQAVSYAINRDAMVTGLGFGFASPAYQLYPGFTQTKISSTVVNEYNLDKARQLLADAGYPDGFRTTIHAFIRIVPRDYISAIANMLAEVGIIVEQDFPEAGAYTELRFGGWSDAMMGHGMADFDNLNSGFTFYFSGTQFQSCQKPDGWQEALDAALATEEIDAAKTQAIVKLIDENQMIIPYMEETRIAFFQDGVHAPDYSQYGLMAFVSDMIWLDEDLK